jgi:ribonuclease-3
MDDFTKRTTLHTFERNLNYKFNNLALLNEALTHASFANEHKIDYDYERLEVLGDSLIGFIIVDFLFNSNPEMREGEISKIKSFVVSEPTLAKAAAKINAPDYIQLGRGEEQNGGMNKPSILADVFEAIVSAIYLDSKKIEFAYEFVIHNLHPEIIKFTQKDGGVNHKSILQEYSLKSYGVKPNYRLIKTLGPEHDKTFIMAVEINEIQLGTGLAKVRKEAEQIAASNAYRHIMEVESENRSENREPGADK